MIQLRLSGIPQQSADALEDLLLEAGALAVTLQDAADQPVLEPAPGETPLWDLSTVIALFPADTDPHAVLLVVQGRLAETGLTRLPEWTTDLVEQKDWERAWMDHYHPIPFGDRLWICPSWREPPDPDAVNLLLDPGLAFGTGTHPTTALCLRWLNDHDVTGHHVMDYGCGSGVLGIAALLLGAGQMAGVDIDRQAVQATRANAERNGIDPDRYAVWLPDEAESVTADTLLANILAGPLLSLRETLVNGLKPGGHLVLSGIIRNQVESIVAAYDDSLYDIEVEYEEEWARIAGRRRDTRS